jgi:transcriptional regulator with XRE-family HTH domain
METTLTLERMELEFAVPRKKTTKKDNETFGDRLAKFRKDAGYSQRALAQEIGISQRMLAYYETRAHKPPSHVLPDIAEALGVSVDVLLGIEKPNKKKPPPVNRKMLAKIRKIEQLPKRDQQAIMRTIDAFLAKE